MSRDGVKTGKFESNGNFQKAIRFANDDQKAELESYLSSANQAQAARQAEEQAAQAVRQAEKERTRALVKHRREYLVKAKVADMLACWREIAEVLTWSV